MCTEYAVGIAAHAELEEPLPAYLGRREQGRRPIEQSSGVID